MADIDRNTAHQDLAFLRELVDDGDGRPSLWMFGATYLAIGLAIAAQVIVTGILLALAVPTPAALLGIIGVWAIYSFVQGWIGRRAKAMGAAGFGAGVRSRASGAAFLGMLLSHLVMLAVFVILSARLQDWTFMQIAALSFFAVQGAMWLVLHAVGRKAWQLAEAFAWAGAALVGAFFVGKTGFGALVLIAALVLMVAPGVYMIRVARKPD